MARVQDYSCRTGDKRHNNLIQCFHAHIKLLAGIESDHFEVCSSLQSLDKNQILYVGGALGLSFTVLQRMQNLPKDMVAAWLRKEDFVREDPTWKILTEALRRVGQGGVAQTIEDKKSKQYRVM